MKPKKSILVLSPFFRPNLGGAETHLDDLCRYLTAHNFKVFVLTYQPLVGKRKGEAFEKKKNLEIHRYWWFPNLYYKVEPHPVLNFLYLTPYLFLRAFLFLLKNHQKIDAIHAQGFNGAIAARLVNPFFRKRMVMSTHALYSHSFSPKSWVGKVVGWVLTGFDAILPLAQISKEELVRMGVPEKKMKVYTYWVDQKLFKPRDKINCRKGLGLSGEFIVVTVGRLLRKKGIGVLIEAARKLPQIQFVFIGTGPMDRELKEESEKTKNIVAVGRKTQEKVALYYGAADVVVMLSQYPEGFTRMTLEALSSGRPLVVTNKGCLPEIVSPKVGVLIDPTLTNAIQTLKQLFADPKRLAELTQNARGYAEERFSEENAKLIVKSYYD